MERIDKYNEILKYFIPTRSPNMTVVEKKDATALFGFFVTGFDNDPELRKTQKLLFVPNTKGTTFRDEFNSPHTTRKSIENCIEVDVDEIRNVKLVNEHTNQVQFSLRLS